MQKNKVDVQGTLRSWAAALLATADLQKELEEASKDMRFGDDWDWQQPFRAIVFDVWGVLTTKPASARLAAAEEYKEKALNATLAVREIARRKAEERSEQ